MSDKRRTHIVPIVCAKLDLSDYKRPEMCNGTGRIELEIFENDENLENRIINELTSFYVKDFYEYLHDHEYDEDFEGIKDIGFELYFQYYIFEWSYFYNDHWIDFKPPSDEDLVKKINEIIQKNKEKEEVD